MKRAKIRLENFWEHVNKTSDNSECWNWMGAKFSENGYGYICANRKHLHAHRIAWQLTFGQLDEKTFISHKCCNKTCCNPSHMFLGLEVDNEKGPTVKLSNDVVKQIRKEYSRGYLSQREVAEMFGTTQSNVSLIVNMKHRMAPKTNYKNLSYINSECANG